MNKKLLILIMSVMSLIAVSCNDSATRAAESCRNRVRMEEENYGESRILLIENNYHITVYKCKSIDSLGRTKERLMTVNSDTGEIISSDEITW